MPPSNPIFDFVIAIAQETIARVEEQLTNLREDRDILYARITQLDGLIAEGEVRLNRLRRAMRAR